MKKIISAVTVSLMLAGGLTLATPAKADTTWDFASGSLTLSDGQGSSATVGLQNLKVVGSSASGTVRLSNARYDCSTRAFSGLTATFTNGGQYDPCYGTVTFSVDSSGVLTVTDSSVYIPATLLTGPGTGLVAGVGPSLTSCAVAVSGDQANVNWVAQGSGLTDFSIGIVNSANPSVDVPGGSGPGSATVPLAGETPGTLQIAIEINNDGNLIFPCANFAYYPAPGAPAIVGSPIGVLGGQVTVNYSVANPATVQGIEYQIDSGAWTRPGGTAPTGGVGGAFTVTGLVDGQHTITLRSVGFNPTPVTTDGTPTSFDIPAPAPAKKPTAGAKPSQGTAAPVAVGSTPSKPIPAPPATPVSAVAGTSNGAGTGTNGALAANTGDAGIDAPCLAANGTLYPNQYSTVGSQLTMASNTRGLGKATSFTVTAGALAPGMQLDRTYGVLFGVTSQVGSWVTTIQARFADGTSKSSQFTTRVDADAQTLQYAAQNIGSVGSRIAIAPTTNAPVTGTTYELVCGELPAGTRLDPRTGVIAGKPTSPVALPTPLRIAETSTTGKAAASFIFVVNPEGTTSISYPAHPHVRSGKRVAIRPTVAGVGDIALFRMWKGKLPKGLHLNRTTGAITGRVAHRGPTHTITIVAVTKGGALLTANPMRLKLHR